MHPNKPTTVARRWHLYYHLCNFLPLARPLARSSARFCLLHLLRSSKYPQPSCFLSDSQFLRSFDSAHMHTHIQSKYFHPHILKMSAPIYGSNGPNGSAKSEELETRCFCIYVCIYVYVHIVLGTRPKLGNKLFCFPMFSGHGIADTAKGYDDREKISDIN